MKTRKAKGPQKYISPYLGAVLLGFVLLGSFIITGQGLGASGALSSLVSQVAKFISPEHVNANGYFSKIAGGDKNPMNNWLVFQVLGIFLGAMISGALAGRIKVETNKGERITVKQRWVFAFIGGVMFGLGAKLARGCTSGFLLTGASTLALGAWLAVPVLFGVAYITAYFVRKLWI